MVIRTRSAGSSADHIVVFARWPEPGRVKTRLVPPLTPVEACDLHRALVAAALAAAAGAPASTRTIAWADAPAAPAAPAGVAIPSGFAVRDQGHGDLGARLERVFADLLAAPGARVVVVGADCPDLGALQITRAFAALASHDLVLGPARDGGYYLIGLARPEPRLFHGIEWGTDRVLAQTLERAAGLTVARLEVLDDLDTPADLARWRSRAGGAAASGAGQADASKARAPA